jgi:hypothetical protein
MKQNNSRIKTIIRQHLSDSVQGNILPTLEAIQALDPAALTEAEQNERQDFISRFVEKEFPTQPDLPPFLAETLNIYQNYWHQVITGKIDLETGNENLDRKLTNLLHTHINPAANYADRDQIQSAVIETGKKLGYGMLLDTTLPFEECMIWQTRVEKVYPVELHDVRTEVKIIFLDDFASRGWLGFATLNRAYTGGWAKNDCIFSTNNPPENENDEAFYINILCHEGRHYSDKQIYAKLEQPELEFRAKLTELCFATETLFEHVEKFINGADNAGRNAPHAYADHHVLRCLARALFDRDDIHELAQWKTLDIKQIQNEAKAILDKNTHWLQNNDPGNIETFIEVWQSS